jgi:GNAT superfamily N-acetyltransferase
MVNLRSAAENVLNETGFQYEIETTDPTSLIVHIYQDGNMVSHFRLSTLPANPFYVIGWGVEVMPEYRGQGLGQVFLRKRIEIVRQSGAHSYINTVNWENDVQVHIMRKHGFEPVMDGGKHAMWGRRVDDEALHDVLAKLPYAEYEDGRVTLADHDDFELEHY